MQSLRGARGHELGCVELGTEGTDSWNQIRVQDGTMRLEEHSGHLLSGQYWPEAKLIVEEGKQSGSNGGNKCKIMCEVKEFRGRSKCCEILYGNRSNRQQGSTDGLCSRPHREGLKWAHITPGEGSPLGYHKEGYSTTLREQTEETEAESNLVRLCAVLCPQNEALKG